MIENQVFEGITAVFSTDPVMGLKMVGLGPAAPNNDQSGWSSHGIKEFALPTAGMRRTITGFN
jgi:hypothetical protein